MTATQRLASALPPRPPQGYHDALLWALTNLPAKRRPHRWLLAAVLLAIVAGAALTAWLNAAVLVHWLARLLFIAGRPG